MKCITRETPSARALPSRRMASRTTHPAVAYLRSMNRFMAGLTLVASCAAAAIAAPSFARTLDIYFIDVEGGQATLIITPAGETMLIDAGFPGDGGFNARPAHPNYSRDANRILAAANDARIQRIDYL